MGDSGASARGGPPDVVQLESSALTAAKNTMDDFGVLMGLPYVSRLQESSLSLTFVVGTS